MRRGPRAIPVVVLCFGLWGCQSVVVSVEHASGSGAGGSDAAPGVCLRHPPARPDGIFGGGADEIVLAISRVSLGDVAMGEPDSAGWQHLGYDLDGIGDGPKNAAECHPIKGTECGVDNVFGAMVSLNPGMSSDANDRIAEGRLPVLAFRVRNLDLKAPASTAAAAIILAEPLGGSPIWDGNDAFGAHVEWLFNDDLEQPRLEIEASYTEGGVWVSGPIPELQVQLPIFDTTGADDRSFLLPLRNVVVTMKLADDGLSATAGTIAGVVLPNEFVDAAVVNQIGRTVPELCGNLDIYDQAQIMVDIDSAGGGKCDAISVGLGFEARAVHLVGISPPQPAVVPCTGWGG